jgi:hypothetical protein
LAAYGKAKLLPRLQSCERPHPADIPREGGGNARRHPVIPATRADEVPANARQSTTSAGNGRNTGPGFASRRSPVRSRLRSIGESADFAGNFWLGGASADNGSERGASGPAAARRCRRTTSTICSSLGRRQEGSAVTSPPRFERPPGDGSHSAALRWSRRTGVSTPSIRPTCTAIAEDLTQA